MPTSARGRIVLRPYGFYQSPYENVGEGLCALPLDGAYPCGRGQSPAPTDSIPSWCEGVGMDSLLISNSSLLIENSPLSTPNKVSLYAHIAFSAPKRLKNGLFEVWADIGLYFWVIFAKIGQKNTQKALKKFPLYVTIIICGGISPFPQFDILREEFLIWIP